MSPTERNGSDTLLPELGFGGASFARGAGPAGDLDAAEAIEAALEAGITYFDVAPFYGHGLAEARLGAGLRWVERSRYQLSTKVGIRIGVEPTAHSKLRDAWAGNLPFHAQPDFTPAGTEQIIQTSEARLGLGRVDGLLVQGLGTFPGSIEAAIAGSIPALVEWRDAGRVRWIGAGVNDPGTGLAIALESDLDMLMVAGGLSLTDWSALTKLVPLCASRGITVVAAAPFLAAKMDVSPDGVIGTVASRFDVPARSAPLQFPLLFDAVTTMVVGMRTASQVAETVTAFRHPLPMDFWHDLFGELAVGDELPDGWISGAEALLESRTGD